MGLGRSTSEESGDRVKAPGGKERMSGNDMYETGNGAGGGGVFDEWVQDKEGEGGERE